MCGRESLLRNQEIDSGRELIDGSGADLNRRSHRAKIILDRILGFVSISRSTAFIRTMLIDVMTLAAGEGQGTPHDEWLIDRGRALGRIRGRRIIAMWYPRARLPGIRNGPRASVRTGRLV